MKSNDGLNAQTSGAGYAFLTLAFPTRWTGFYGGRYSGSPSGLNRKVKDEAGIFSTHFYYDRLGRIVVSQNTKQFNNTVNKKYSYTVYDELGRISEVGEKVDNSNSSEVQFREIFGLSVNGYFNPKVIDDVKLTGFINGTTGVRAEVTRTFYTSSPIASGITQENLRNRVVTTAYYPTSNAAYQHATHYSYDIHGNVKTLIQDFPGMGIPAPANSKKQIDYRYDLISGNVLQVSYQAGYLDQYYHRYEYDADNRITAVYTSDYGWEGATGALNLNMPEDMMFWEKDAVYRYYKHGPLAKVELGELGVQGVDYAYTLQGWLKGVNSTKLDEVNDMGKDGNLAMNTPYQYFARDAFSFNLSYFKGDYDPIRGPQVGTATCWLADNTGSFTQTNRFNLWNGNIGAMATTLNTGGSNPMNLYQNMAYQYDQLNRLILAVGQGNFDEQNNSWGSNADITNRYKNEFTYDPNGNILTQKRHDQAGVLFDDLRYRYNYNLEGRFIDNRLYHVSDNIGAAVKTDDIDNQTGNVVFGPKVRADYAAELNYFYDELGQLIRDKQEKIENITWRVDGKISYISRNNGSGKSELAFVYDAMGNRVEKTENNDAGVWSNTEYYVRDAQGNVMAIYKKYIRNNQLFYDLTEQHIYGSSRLGVDRRGVDVIAASTVTDNVSRSIKRGEKHYELSNHLGNVLATLSDKKIAVMSGANLSYYRADVASYSDYYPFGAPMTERTAVVTPTDVRYGFQGQEEDDELWNGAVSFKYRVEDARLGRFFSVDPLSSKFPWNSCYAFSENDVLRCIELEGNEKWSVIDGMRGQTTVQGPFMDQAAAQNYYDTNYSLSSKLQVTNDGFVMSERIEKHRILNLERGPISNDIQGIVLHRTVSSNTSSPLQSFGQKGVGTHFLIGKDGKIIQTASLNYRTSHLRESQLKQGAPKNSSAIGIEVVGMYYESEELWDPLTEEQINSTVWLVNSLLDLYDLDVNKLYNHEDIQPKTAGEGRVVYDSIISNVQSGNNEIDTGNESEDKLFNFSWDVE